MQEQTFEARISKQEKMFSESAIMTIQENLINNPISNLIIIIFVETFHLTVVSNKISDCFIISLRQN